MIIGDMPRRGTDQKGRASRLNTVRARSAPLLKSLSLAPALVALSATLALGQIQNGSFENDYANWTASGHQAIATNDPSHPASNGSKVVVFNPNDMFANAVLSQTFATTPGQRYGLALDLGTVGAIADQRLEVSLTGNGTLLDQVVTVSSPDAGAFYVPQH